MATPVLVSKARKRYECDKCHGIIEPGTPYWWVNSSSMKSGYEFRHDKPECRFSDVAPAVSTPKETKRDASKPVLPKYGFSVQNRKNPHLDDDLKEMTTLREGLEKIGLKYDARFVSGTHPKWPGQRFSHRVYSLHALTEKGWNADQLIQDFMEVTRASALPLFFSFHGDIKYGFVGLWVGPFMEDLPKDMVVEDIGEPFEIVVTGGEKVE